MKTIDDLIRQMSLCLGDAEGATRTAIGEILSICEPYRGMGHAFTFTLSGDLDRDVNRILALLSDTLLSEWGGRANDVTGNDAGAVAFASGERDGQTARERLDRHSSRLKYIVEGWAAVGFVNGLKQAETLDRTMRYIRNPFGSPMWADAVHERGRYSATIIADGDLNRRPGRMNSVTAAMALVGETILSSAYRYAEIGSLRRGGASFYGVRRGSGFDCPYCDDICSRIYPVEHIVLPAHPRCMCEPYPV